MPLAGFTGWLGASDGVGRLPVLITGALGDVGTGAGVVVSGLNVKVGKGSEGVTAASSAGTTMSFALCRWACGRPWTLESVASRVTKIMAEENMIERECKFAEF